jgi:hypothetical protein
VPGARYRERVRRRPRRGSPVSERGRVATGLRAWAWAYGGHGHLLLRLGADGAGGDTPEGCCCCCCCLLLVLHHGGGRTMDDATSAWDRCSHVAEACRAEWRPKSKAEALLDAIAHTNSTACTSRTSVARSRRNVFDSSRPRARFSVAQTVPDLRALESKPSSRAVSPAQHLQLTRKISTRMAVLAGEPDEGRPPSRSRTLPCVEKKASDRGERMSGCPSHGLAAFRPISMSALHPCRTRHCSYCVHSYRIYHQASIHVEGRKPHSPPLHSYPNACPSLQRWEPPGAFSSPVLMFCLVASNRRVRGVRDPSSKSPIG